MPRISISQSNSLDLMELMKVLNIILNNNGLRQSPCNTPLSIGMKGLEYEDVVTEVWKPV